MNQRITAPLAATETKITSIARPLTDSTWLMKQSGLKSFVRIDTTGLIGFEPKSNVSGNSSTMDGHPVVETPCLALRPLFGLSLLER
jgi:hypothetical protein